MVSSEARKPCSMQSTPARMQACTDESPTAWAATDGRSPSCSIEKARALLGYRPAYSSLRTAHEAVRWLVEHDRLGIDPAQLLEAHPL